MIYKLAIVWMLVACLAAVSRAARAEEVRLFDDHSLEGWTTLEGRPVTAGWKVVDGMLRLDPAHGRAGHIVTRRQFGDFELSFEWKIARGGNSGLKYRVRDYAGKLYGCEYQILDDAGYRNAVSPRQSAGALYDLYEPSSRKRLAPVGEFNHSRIVVRGNSIEHWLNGARIVSANVGDAEWRTRVAASKFADVQGFGQNRRGRIMLTDHGSEAWYRNFKFLLLPMADH